MEPPGSLSPSRLRHAGSVRSYSPQPRSSGRQAPSPRVTVPATSHSSASHSFSSRSSGASTYSARESRMETEYHACPSSSHVSGRRNRHRGEGNDSRSPHSSLSHTADSSCACRSREFPSRGERRFRRSDHEASSGGRTPSSLPLRRVVAWVFAFLRAPKRSSLASFSLLRGSPRRYARLLPLSALVFLAVLAAGFTVFFLLTLPLRFLLPSYAPSSPPSWRSPSYFFSIDRVPFGAPTPPRLEPGRTAVSTPRLDAPPSGLSLSSRLSLSRFFLATPQPARGSASGSSSPHAGRGLSAWRPAHAVPDAATRPRRLQASSTIQVGPPEGYTGFSVDHLWNAFLSGPQEYMLFLWFLVCLVMFACFCSWSCRQRSFQKAVLVSP
ncbi:hypothetical protein BESB_028130 [Besnoitia besnoiti]|uniref:Transmembrane protein n=1 Tax=Besnoitia besnoiti TaxID=94643 RepID=A0A2A9LY51_BESBE|nr:uncharacterized protein BESB_028130 [Besnoitia besnoiti]PFH31378.1 hypothetical protein BESB_028130 [Besnoitia besnoiti]